GAVGQERHVLLREDLADDALVAVAASELVAVLALALLRHAHADELIYARRQIHVVLAGEHANTDEPAVPTLAHPPRGVADLARLLTEDRAEQALLGGQLGLALRRDLADEDVAVADLGADADDATLVEVGEDLVGDVRDVAGDLLGTELGVASVDLVLLDVDRGEHVLLHEALRQDDRVLVVVAFPRHDRHEQVLAERHLTVLGAGAVGEDLAGLDALSFVHDRTLVRAGALVRTVELAQTVGLAGSIVGHDRDEVGGDLFDHAALLGDDDVAGVDGGTQLHAGTDDRR